jgi:regulator of sigma E protease
MITSIVAAVLIFAVLVLVHEAGHFVMAKRLGVRVIRFSIGYPPRVWGFRRGETDYAIGATPLGGYVRMLGDEIAEEPSASTLDGYIQEIELDILEGARETGWLAASGKTGDDALAAIASELAPAAGEPISAGRAIAVIGHEPNPEETLILREVAKDGTVKRARETLCEGRPSAFIERFNLRAFPSQPLWRRIAIVLAGPLSNILFAPIALTIVFMVGIPVTLPVIGKIFPDKPAAVAGLRTGDRIISVNGTATETWLDLSREVKESGGAKLRLVVRRVEGSAAKTVNIIVQPVRIAEETAEYGSKSRVWVIGVLPRGDEIKEHVPILRAIRRGVVQTWTMSHDIVVGIVKIIDGSTPARKALGGPIMIAQLAGQEAHRGFADVALFTVMLSLELGIVNLLPVPLLDGGHFMFFMIEAMRGKPLKLRHREIAMEVGLFLLFILMAFVILNDISRIIG